MYNLNQLWTFIKVAEAGSFNRVAEEEYMSPSAIMKQIDNLEAELGGMKLFIRSKRGNTLTEVGRMFYQEAKKVLQYCDESRDRVVAAGRTEMNTIRISTTHMAAKQIVYDVWQTFHKWYPEWRVIEVPYSFEFSDMMKLWSNFNEWTDIALCAYNDIDPNDPYDVIKLCELPTMCTMSVNHRLAGKESIEISDLKSENVIVIGSGWESKTVNELKERLAGANIIESNIADFEHGYNIYNEAANSDTIVIDTISSYEPHVFLKSIPFNCGINTDYGLMFMKKHSKKFARFLHDFKNTLALVKTDKNEA